MLEVLFVTKCHIIQLLFHTIDQLCSDKSQRSQRATFLLQVHVSYILSNTLRNSTSDLKIYFNIDILKMQWFVCKRICMRSRLIVESSRTTTETEQQGVKCLSSFTLRGPQHPQTNYRLMFSGMWKS